MIVYLASLTCSFSQKQLNTMDFSDVALLESFAYNCKWTVQNIPKIKRFILDSGAFTFFKVTPKNVNWEKYVDDYADFVIQNRVEKFLELDIDKIIGFEKTLRLRKRLESRVGRQCIPVWHKSRGKEFFLKECEEYPYVAIGGIASHEIKSNEYGYLRWFVDEAHKRNVKIHGLGFTHMEWLPKIHFDSVDSSSWANGQRYGMWYIFDGKTLYYKKASIESAARKIKLRCKKNVVMNNLKQWILFQKYAEEHL